MRRGLLKKSTMSSKRTAHRRKKATSHLWIIASAAFILCFIALGSHAYNSVVNKSLKLQDYSEVVSKLSGAKGRSRTLLLFTNNAEMRYGGGFIGSVGYIDAQKGGHVEIDPIHSVYYYDHRLEEGDSRLEAATPELSLLTSKIWLRDSGVDLDWRSNAHRAASLFELESGKQVDNVVMVTPNVIKGMLKVTGPVYLKDYDLNVTSDNFLKKVQLEVEAGDDKQAGKDPKTILGVLANTLLAQLFEKGRLQDVSKFKALLSDVSKQKQVAVYSEDGVVQSKIRGLGLDGGLEPAEGNYMMLADANLGANKSSPFITQDVHQKMTLAKDGKATVELTWTRKHKGAYSHQYIDPHDGLTKWLVGANIGFIKLAVPKGSSVLYSSADLARPVYTESGRDVITLASNLEPGASATYVVRYELPFRYSMGPEVQVKSLFEKPIGSFDSTVSQNVELPQDYRLASGTRLSNAVLNKDLESRLMYVKR